MYEFYNKIDNGKQEIKGYIGFFCPNCFNSIIINAKINIEGYNYQNNNKLDCYINSCFYVRCDECESYNYYDHFLDPNITKFIAKLNYKGYITRTCCEGHEYDKDSDGYIAFQSVEPNIEKMRMISPWYLEKNSYYYNKYGKKIKNTTIRAKLNSTLEERMDSLDKMIFILPNKRGVL